MKLDKINLSQLENAELNEKELCRLLGGGRPGCCQCGCHYAGTEGGSSSSANDSANNEHGYTSDPGKYPWDIYVPCTFPSQEELENELGGY